MIGHIAAGLMAVPLRGISPPKIVKIDVFCTTSGLYATAMSEAVPLIWPDCLRKLYALAALLACLWQPWQEFEKPYVAQMDDHVGAAPERGGQSVPASGDGSPVEPELALPDEPRLLPLLSAPEPKPPELPLDARPLLDPELPVDSPPRFAPEPPLDPMPAPDPEPPLDPALPLDPDAPLDPRLPLLPEPELFADRPEPLLGSPAPPPSVSVDPASSETTSVPSRLHPTMATQPIDVAIIV
jgi:hypothetical protein